MLRFWRWPRSSTLSNALSVSRGDERAHGLRRLREACVSSVEIDMDRQKVTVTGYVDRREVLRAARRTGRAAEFWPWPYDAEYYPFAIQYLVDDTYLPTDRYYRHGYNDPMIGSYPCHAFTHVLDDAALAVFHEDNVHACALM
uniref:HMA domain-containing protein n=1 Tax=Setaria italica TaxID=4555 RepID=K3YZ91_SETIT